MAAHGVPSNTFKLFLAHKPLRSFHTRSAINSHSVGLREGPLSTRIRLAGMERNGIIAAQVDGMVSHLLVFCAE